MFAIIKLLLIVLHTLRSADKVLNGTLILFLYTTEKFFKGTVSILSY